MPRRDLPGRLGQRRRSNGRLSPFIELGVGFNSDLTARENVIINAIMLGLTREQARERFDEIIAFAELEEFIDLKLKNYSSGMHVRLAFSVAIQVDADILLVDEVLAVGDAAFQQKCFDAFDALKADGRTIVFVTHDMTRGRALLRPRDADRARAGAVDRRPARDRARVQRAQLRAARPRRRPRASATATTPWPRSLAVLVRGRRRRARHGARPGRAARRLHGRPLPRAVDEPIFAVSLRNEAAAHGVRDVHAIGPATATGQLRAPATTARVRIAFDNWLAPSRYDATPSVARAGAGDDALDVREDLASLIVHGTRVTRRDRRRAAHDRGDAP